jgi:hypothetical protein
VPSAFNTSEFRRSDGPLQHNAATAWNAGHTGQGVTIAVIDSGLDADSPEFAGRVSSASKDMYDQGRPLEGPEDHGTSVAMVAAAARNSTGVVGIAYNATVMALRSDEPGSCPAATTPGSTSTSSADCNFLDSVLAKAVTYAVQNGAKVINMSLGGDDGTTAAMRTAVVNAVNAGAVVVVSAGNDGTAQVSAFAAQLDQAAPGGVIIVGSVDENGVISDFSDRAGTHASQYLTARGEDVCCVYKDGQLYVDPQGYIYVMSGTSFSAPQVSGAAALLAQAFPNLPGKQIAQILLQSAFDAGSGGTDAVYGRGILDIAKAFQPIGTTALAGGTTAVALGDATGAASQAMGDALTRASLPAIVLDEYDRAFQTDLAGTLRGAQPAGRLGAAVAATTRNVEFASKQASLAFSIDRSGRAGEPTHVTQLRLGSEDAEQARVLAARVTARINPKLQFGFAYREQGDGLAAQLQGQAQPAFLVAPSAAGDAARAERPDAAFALRQQVGRWGLTVSGGRGEVLSGAMRRAAEMTDRRFESGTASYGIALDRRFGAVETSLGLTWQAEDQTFLGGRFHEAFGLSGADTLFLDARAGWQLAPGWRLGGALREGFTRARVGGAIASGSSVDSRAWSLDLTRTGVFATGDTLGFRLSQPLRVEGGALNLSLPVAWSYDTLAATYRVRSLSLAPQGRELVGELAWQGRVLGGNGAASLFYRRDPGHYAQVPDDQGAAIRWSAKF